MKRTVALLLLLVLLCTASALANESFSPPELPQLTPAYSLSQFYGDLERQWGHVNQWALEQKAWLSGELDKLVSQENTRREAMGADLTTRFAYPLGIYQHGLPEETAIDQATALSMACDQFTAQGAALSSDDMADIGFYYLVDDPQHPVWYHAVSIDGTAYRTYMDAHTGKFASASVFDVTDKAAAQLPADIPLHLYGAVAFYRPADDQWLVQFHHVLPNQPQYAVTLSDTTLDVLNVQ